MLNYRILLVLIPREVPYDMQLLYVLCDKGSLLPYGTLEGLYEIAIVEQSSKIIREA